jgi:hypothetical protein
MNPIHHRVLHLDVGLIGFLILLMRPTPHASKCGDRLDARNHVGQRRDEMGAPHLPVGHDVDAASFLQRDHFIDGAIFETLEVARAEAARLPSLARVLEISRPQHRTNHFRAIFDLHLRFLRNSGGAVV